MDNKLQVDKIIVDCMRKSLEVAVFDIVNGAVRDMLKDGPVADLVRKRVELEMRRLFQSMDSSSSGSEPDTSQGTSL